ncbi:PTB domain-containing protein [Sarcoptes scabiei]|uniref:PTB domain-containing protein n=1 Tax=Sarcoptes scabiei TaxID=52283 RepID=A0A131ZYY5_SARSC|nr:PTB domain-containing protein [Sarcoptes scabiei]
MTRHGWKFVALRRKQKESISSNSSNGKSKQISSSLSSSSSSLVSNQNQSNLQSQASSTKQQQKLWIHPPATLQNGHIAYLVKYFGNVEVNQPKGIEVVKESISRLKFIQPIKKSEGSKIPKVELTISVNGVAIQQPKTKKIYCQFPLHRISYCADDKTEKKFFSFIAKDIDTDKHLCFVFMSEKMSEEIILTIGQAFDLAYAKFIETSGRELEIRKQLILMQKKVCRLEEKNKQLKERLRKYEPVEDDENEDEDAIKIEKTNEMEESKTNQNDASTNESTASMNVNGNAAMQKSANSMPVPPLQPPPSAKKRGNQQISLIDVDVDLECNNNVLTLLDNANDFNGTSGFSKTNNGTVSSSQNIKLMSDFPIDDNIGAFITQEKDIFGCEPFKVKNEDPFGMTQFNENDLDSAIVDIDKKLAEMRLGFSQGLSADGFNMDSS